MQHKMEYSFESNGDPRMRHLHFTTPALTAPIEVWCGV